MQSLLNKIQQELKAPKGQYNNFGRYHYRSCEDILNAVKPLLGKAILTISDEVVMKGDRYYVKATATIEDGEKSISATAYAREAVMKKGMDEAQITGAASSYARKYALNGLFAIDDEKDPDTQKPAPTAKSASKIPAKTQGEAQGGGKTEGAVCEQCGEGTIVRNPRTGKLFCDQKCWLKQQDPNESPF